MSGSIISCHPGEGHPNLTYQSRSRLGLHFLEISDILAAVHAWEGLLCVAASPLSLMKSMAFPSEMGDDTFFRGKDTGV